MKLKQNVWVSDDLFYRVEETEAGVFEATYFDGEEIATIVAADAENAEEIRADLASEAMDIDGWEDGAGGTISVDYPGHGVVEKEIDVGQTEYLQITEYRISDGSRVYEVSTQRGANPSDHVETHGWFRDYADASKEAERLS